MMNIYKRFLVVLAMMLVFPASSSAEFFYTTKKTDTFQGVAVKFEVPEQRLRAMNPRISEINQWKQVRIPSKKIGKEKNGTTMVANLSVPESAPLVKEKRRNARQSVAKKSTYDPEGPWEWRVPNADPFVGDESLAFKQMELEPSEIVELQQLIATRNFTMGTIKVGDHFDIQIYSHNVKQRDVTVAFKEGHTEPARVYKLSTGKEVWWPKVCSNWSVRLLVKPKKPRVPPTTTTTITAPPTTIKVPKTPSDGPDVDGTCEAIMGGGVYQDAHGADHKGGYWWIKGRCYPIETALKNGLIVRTGIVATALGGGGDDRGFNYNWNQYGIGPSFNLIGEGWDANIDLMYSHLYNDGDFSHYRSKQKDTAFVTSIHLNWYERRMRGELLFPKWEANLEWRHILGTEFESYWEGRRLNESPNKNGSAELTYTQYLYDFYFDNRLRVSPWFKAGIGYEKNGDDPFWSIMPGVSFGMDDIDVIHAGVMGYKQMINDSDRAQISPFAVTLDLGGAVKAYRKSNIKKTPYKELLPRTTYEYMEKSPQTTTLPTSLPKEQSTKTSALPATLQMVKN